jgi:hypothetical protein
VEVEAAEVEPVVVAVQLVQQAVPVSLAESTL